MSPITAAYYEEVGGSFFACPCFFQVTMMKFLIDLKEDKATGGYTVLLLTLIKFHCSLHRFFLTI